MAFTLLFASPSVEVCPCHTVVSSTSTCWGRKWPTSRIAQELSYDGRAALKTVGDKLGISETQVRTRIQAMLSSGTMDILAIINPMNLKNRCIAWVAIRSNSERPLRQIADELAKISYVHYVVICSGRFNIFVEFVCPSTTICSTCSTSARGR